MAYSYKNPKGGFEKSALLLGLACAALLFLLVPLLQIYTKQDAATLNTVESVDYAPPAPPPPRVEPDPPPEEVEKPPTPEFTPPPVMPTLEQLELSLNPGFGGDLSLDNQINFDLTTESSEELSRLFGFDELDEVPSLVRRGRPRGQLSAEFQRVMRRNDTKQVVLEVAVNERGEVSVTGVQSATHEALIDAAKQAAEASRFSTPLRNGKPVSASYIWPLKF